MVRAGGGDAAGSPAAVMLWGCSPGVAGRGSREFSVGEDVCITPSGSRHDLFLRSAKTSHVTKIQNNLLFNNMNIFAVRAIQAAAGSGCRLQGAAAETSATRKSGRLQRLLRGADAAGYRSNAICERAMASAAGVALGLGQAGGLCGCRLAGARLVGFAGVLLPFAGRLVKTCSGSWLLSAGGGGGAASGA